MPRPRGPGRAGTTMKGARRRDGPRPFPRPRPVIEERSVPWERQAEGRALIVRSLTRTRGSCAARRWSQDIKLKIGKDPKSHLRVDDELWLAHARRGRGDLARGHHPSSISANRAPAPPLSTAPASTRARSPPATGSRSARPASSSSAPEPIAFAAPPAPPPRASPARTRSRSTAPNPFGAASAQSPFAGDAFGWRNVANPFRRRRPCPRGTRCRPTRPRARTRTRS